MRRTHITVEPHNVDLLVTKDQRDELLRWAETLPAEIMVDAPEWLQDLLAQLEEDDDTLFLANLGLG